MNNALSHVFGENKKGLLNVYFTAGFPAPYSTTEVLFALQDSGADIIEIGMPYSDPIADGPVIMAANELALKNGMTIQRLLQQLARVKEKVRVPLILMGYLNPILQYGIERFCEDAASAGVSGLIVPDIPAREYVKKYKKLFEKNNLSAIFLVTPQTSEKRIRETDQICSGFLYVVSSSATTGVSKGNSHSTEYFKRIAEMKLTNPLLIGFGIGTRERFLEACEYAAGAIVGSAYISAIANSTDISATTAAFIRGLKG